MTADEKDHRNATIPNGNENQIQVHQEKFI